MDRNGNGVCGGAVKQDNEVQVQPQTSSAVTFRRQQSVFGPSPISGGGSSAKPKPHPPPKPASLINSSTTALKNKSPPADLLQGVVPQGTVKALSKDLEKQLFVKPPPRSVAAIEPTSSTVHHAVGAEEPTSSSSSSAASEQHVVRLGGNNYEIAHGLPLQMFSESAAPMALKKAEAATSTDRGLVPDEPEYDLVYEDQFDDDWDAPTPPEYDAEPVQEDPDMYATNVELRRPWLIDGHPTRQQAALAVKGKAEGAFVIRRRCGPDSHIFPYALTVIYKDRPVHMQIQRTEDSGLVLAPWKAGEKPFATLDELVQYYRDNRIAFVQNSLQGFVSLQKGNFLYD